MARLAVRLVDPPGYAHAGALVEIAEALEHGARELGHDVVRRSESVADGRTEIVVGWHLLEPDDATVPHDAVFYNLEQVTPESKWFTPERIAVLRGRRVWDYSPANVARLALLGIDAVLVPVGYVPQWTRIERAAEDIDVLFYGSTS